MLSLRYPVRIVLHYRLKRLKVYALRVNLQQVKLFYPLYATVQFLRTYYPIIISIQLLEQPLHLHLC